VDENETAQADFAIFLNFFEFPHVGKPSLHLGKPLLHVGKPLLHLGKWSLHVGRVALHVVKASLQAVLASPQVVLAPVQVAVLFRCVVLRCLTFDSATRRDVIAPSMKWRFASRTDLSRTATPAV